MVEKNSNSENLNSEKKLTFTRREFLALSAGAAIALAIGDKIIFINDQKEDSPNPEAEKPKVRLNFFFNAHGTGADLNGVDELKNKIMQNDVFVPEAYDWNEEKLRSYRSVAAGQTPYTTIFLETTSASTDGTLLRALHNTQKEVMLVDIPVGHPLSGKHVNLLKSAQINIGEPFSETLAQIRQAAIDWADFETARDNMMSQNLSSKISELSDNPKFKNKKEINVLIEIGASHTRLFEWAQTNTESTSQEFAQKPFIYGFWNEATRRYWMRKDNQYFPVKNVPEPDDRLIANAAFELLLEDLYAKELRNVSSKTVVVNHVLRRIIGQFSFEEIQDIFDKLKQQNDDFNVKTPQTTKDKASRKIIDQIMATKEVNFPKNRAELEKIVWYKTILK